MVPLHAAMREGPSSCVGNSVAAIMLGLLLLQAASTSATQQLIASAAEEADDKPAIAGLVLSARTNEPLRKVLLRLKNAEHQEAERDIITDASGHFEIKSIEPGRYLLEASRSGFVTQEFSQAGPGSAGTILSLRPGEHLLDISFKLMSAAVMAGHVYDEGGDPIAGAEVQVLRFAYDDGNRKLMLAQDAQTNDLGEFRIFGLSPGHCYIRVSYNPDQLSISGLSYAPQYYPGGDDLSRAISWNIRAGDDLAGIDFILLPVRTFRVSGSVYDAVNGRPGMHAAVWLMPRNREVQSVSPTSESSVLDPHGAFELHGVTPGTYYLYAASTEADKQYIARESITVADADLNNLHVLIGPGIDLKGHIRVEGSAVLDMNVLNIGLRPRDGTIDIGGAASLIKPDASFSILNVAEGTYQLQVDGLPEDFYLKGVRLSGRNGTGSDLNVARTLPLGPLEVVLSPNGGRIDGRVLMAEKPFAGASVVLVPEDRRKKEEHLYKTTSTDQNGQFSMRGLAPGNYLLFAWENLEAGAYEDPEFIRKYRNRGKSIVVEEGSRLSSQLELIANEPSSEH